MRRNTNIVNPMVLGGVLGAAASMYAVSKMNMGQRRMVYKTGRNMARFAGRMMNRMDRNWF
ncbi:hypothetical protein [Tepidibacter formicigenes]|jgi:hypothetical protein|uniref:Uncharacterized protein n=1 Tax=Tepidibacter formicigenes DSM 15518 TaxID=1123349 RepID=A0A1M6PC33_9FIRM|nr:hypothetical protein [Tepidibacter formicigenes]SHK05521.1 hypothetical protein SAMN02744037_01514 [Tepidibacter formicigenes DSM 15518]